MGQDNGNKNNTEWNKRMLIETEAGGGDPELDFQGILTVLQTSWNELDDRREWTY